LNGNHKNPKQLGWAIHLINASTAKIESNEVSRIADAWPESGGDRIVCSKGVQTLAMMTQNIVREYIKAARLEEGSAKKLCRASARNLFTCDKISLLVL
jgi:hypothetical protein